MEKNKWKNKNFLQALKHSVDGIKYAFVNERNLKIQLLIGIAVIIVGIILKLTYVEFGIIILTIGMVIFAELINTAIEIILDLYSQEYNENIKVAKDLASGAVLLTALVSVIIGLIIFMPKIINILI